ncbi:MAG: hypothetical protein K8R36_25390 [Planctomycetales bacterium]|nr:hypothetical protein [Planctomycetales bacterium]
MTETENSTNESVLQTREGASEGAGEISPADDEVSHAKAKTLDNWLEEFFTPRKKNGKPAKNHLEALLKEIAPFRAQSEVPPTPISGKVGRPSVLGPEVKNQLYILLSLGLSRTQAAWYLGIDASTVSHAAKKDSTFAHELVRAEQLKELQPRLAINAACMTDWRAAVWLLTHQNLMESGGEEEGSKGRRGKKRKRARAENRPVGE